MAMSPCRFYGSRATKDVVGGVVGVVGDRCDTEYENKKEKNIIIILKNEQSNKI